MGLLRQHSVIRLILSRVHRGITLAGVAFIDDWGKCYVRANVKV